MIYVDRKYKCTHSKLHHIISSKQEGHTATTQIVGAEPPPSGSGCNSVRSYVWVHGLIYRKCVCQSYINDVHAKSYSHVTTAPPPQCTAFTSHCLQRFAGWLMAVQCNGQMRVDCVNCCRAQRGQ